MKQLEQFDLPCKSNCPFIVGDRRQCGTGYKQKIKPTTLTGIKRTVDILLPERPVCHTNLTEVINTLDDERPSTAFMTDGDPTLAYILTISYFTEKGLLPVGGVNDGTFYTISRINNIIQDDVKSL